MDTGRDPWRISADDRERRVDLTELRIIVARIEERLNIHLDSSREHLDTIETRIEWAVSRLRELSGQIHQVNRTRKLFATAMGSLLTMAAQALYDHFTRG